MIHSSKLIRIQQSSPFCRTDLLAVQVLACWLFLCYLKPDSSHFRSVGLIEDRATHQQDIKVNMILIRYIFLDTIFMSHDNSEIVRIYYIRDC